MPPTETGRRPCMFPTAAYQFIKAVPTVVNAIAWSGIEVPSDHCRTVHNLGRLGKEPVPYGALVWTVLPLRERRKPKPDDVHAGVVQHHVQDVGRHGAVNRGL